jgi:hypothetical protein
MRQLARVVGIGIAGILGAQSGSAQVRYRPTDNGPWRPWHFTAIPTARQNRGATAAELQAWQSRLQELAAIVRRAPAVAQPVGFAAEVWGNLDGYGPPAPGEPSGARLPLAGSLSFGAFPLIEFMRNGKLMNEDLKGGETELLHFTVNHIERGMFQQSMPMEWSGEDAVGFVEPKTRETVAGLTRIDDVLVLVSDRNKARPLWTPLTLEEAMAPALAQRRKLFESRRKNYEDQKREFAEWSSPQQRAARRADWQRSAAGMGAEQGRTFLANMEKTDPEIEKAKKALLAPGGSEERGVQDAEKALREAEALLAAAGQTRAAAACYDKSANRLAARFRPLAGAPPTCEPLVKTNWAFFDPARPRAAPQILMLAQYGRCLTKESVARGDGTRGGCAINRQLVNSIDWDAVRAWMDR